MSKEPQSGHNSQAQLKAIIERVETVEGQIKEFQTDRAEIYAEAKSGGFDVAALKAIVRMRKEDANKRAERETLVETYMAALGMLSDLPLGQAAIERAVA